jgi:hypothetical protein
MNSDSHREFHAKAAKKLLRLLRAREPSALLRGRAVLHDTLGQPDDDVVAAIGLMRCQHVVANEAGFEKWTDLMSAPASGTRGEPAVDPMHAPASGPSEDDLGALLLDFGSRVLRTKSFDHIDRAQESIREYFISQVGV